MEKATGNPQAAGCEMKTRVAEQERGFIQCSFCIDGRIDPKPGKTACTDCHTEFEIDDRGECLFVDTDNLRLPIRGALSAPAVV